MSEVPLYRGCSNLRTRAALGSCSTAEDHFRGGVRCGFLGSEGTYRCKVGRSPKKIHLGLGEMAPSRAMTY